MKDYPIHQSWPQIPAPSSWMDGRGAPATGAVVGGREGLRWLRGFNWIMDRRHLGFIQIAAA